MTSSPYADPAFAYAREVAERIVRTRDMAAASVIPGRAARLLALNKADEDDLRAWGDAHRRDFMGLIR